jgi:hypothetical protein
MLLTAGEFSLGDSVVIATVSVVDIVRVTCYRSSKEYSSSLYGITVRPIFGGH